MREKMINPKELEVIEQIQAEDGTTVEVVQYTRLKGSADVRTARNLYYANQSGMHLKMVRIRLNNSHVRIEPGSLYFMKGKLEMKASTGGGVVKGLTRKMVSGESFFVNEIHGSGEIYLEPTFGHFFLHRINPKEKGIIVEKGFFYAGTAGLDITTTRQKTLSSAVIGQESFFQTRVSGSGIAVLYSPIPSDEIMRYELTGDKLWIDGNYTLMRSEGITYRVQKSSRSWMSTSVSQEGFLQTFEGEGYVWIAPTLGVYELLSTPEGLEMLSQPPKNIASDEEAA